MVRGEVYWIAQEAIRNACAHSNGSRLDVVLDYAIGLALRVRDDGVGIDLRKISHAESGHYGLPGMRERATRIGGKLNIVTAPGEGTEVDLLIPAEIAFLESRTR